MGSTPIWHSVLYVKAVVAAFNQEKALVGAFSVITKLRMDLRFKLYYIQCVTLQLSINGYVKVTEVHTN